MRKIRYPWIRSQYPDSRIQIRIKSLTGLGHCFSLQFSLDKSWPHLPDRPEVGRRWGKDLLQRTAHSLLLFKVSSSSGSQSSSRELIKEHTMNHYVSIKIIISTSLKILNAGHTVINFPHYNTSLRNECNLSTSVKIVCILTWWSMLISWWYLTISPSVRRFSNVNLTMSNYPIFTKRRQHWLFCRAPKVSKV